MLHVDDGVDALEVSVEVMGWTDEDDDEDEDGGVCSLE